MTYKKEYVTEKEVRYSSIIAKPHKVVVIEQ